MSVEAISAASRRLFNRFDQGFLRLHYCQQEGRIYSNGVYSLMPPLRDESIPLLQKLFSAGKVRRSDVALLTGLKERTARSLVSQPTHEGLVSSASSREPILWALPLHAEEYYFPKLAEKS